MILDVNLRTPYAYNVHMYSHMCPHMQSYACTHKCKKKNTTQAACGGAGLSPGKWEFAVNCSLIENISLVPKRLGSACKEILLPRENIEIHICRCSLISCPLKPGSAWALPGTAVGDAEEVPRQPCALLKEVTQAAQVGLGLPPLTCFLKELRSPDQTCHRSWSPRFLKLSSELPVGP